MHACLATSRIPHPHSRHQNGFTLLEVIAAIMLLGIAFAALMKVAGASIALTQNASTHSAAAMWARSALDSAFVTTPVKVGHSAGRFDRRFAWQMDVTPWGNVPGSAGAPQALALYQLDLTVSWAGRGGTNAAHFRTLRLDSATQADAPGQASP
ncbi:MAG: type II secretion system protein [Rhodanobacter sp.]